MHPLSVFLLIGLPLVFAIPTPDGSAATSSSSSNSSSISLPQFYNSSANAIFDDWPKKLPITLGFLNSSTAKLRFTGNGTSGTFLDAEGFAKQAQDEIDLMLFPGQYKPFVPRWVDLRSEQGNNWTFQCGEYIANDKPGGIHWTREFYVDFLQTMQQLVSSYGVRRFTVEVYDPPVSNSTSSGGGKLKVRQVSSSSAGGAVDPLTGISTSSPENSGSSSSSGSSGSGSSGSGSSGSGSSGSSSSGSGSSGSSSSGSTSQADPNTGIITNPSPNTNSSSNSNTGSGSSSDSGTSGSNPVVSTSSSSPKPSSTSSSSSGSDADPTTGIITNPGTSNSSSSSLLDPPSYSNKTTGSAVTGGDVGVTAQAASANSAQPPPPNVTLSGLVTTCTIKPVANLNTIPIDNVANTNSSVNIGQAGGTPLYDLSGPGRKLRRLLRL